MYGWEKLTSMCGLGCKVFWHPWAQNSEKLPYDSVNKDEFDIDDVTEPVTSEPQKPVWSNMQEMKPIVRNKSASVGNVRTSSGYEKVASSTSTEPVITDKRHSTSGLDVSTVSGKGLLSNSKPVSGSRASLDGKLEVSQLVTTV